LVKENAPQLLRKELASHKWKPQPLAISGVTDPYQPAERKFRITRQCLEVLVQFRNPVVIITKNHLVTRDIDLLQELAAFSAIKVFVSIPTLDKELSGKLEPRTSGPERRLIAIQKLSQSGVPVGVLVAPIIPALTDHEIFSVAKKAKMARAEFASYIALRLPYALKSLFENWLDMNYPDKKDKVLNRIRGIRGGKLYDSEFSQRMVGDGLFSEQIANSFKIACASAGLPMKGPNISAKDFIRQGQMKMLF
jgi:DNA repair photolyase